MTKAIRIYLALLFALLGFLILWQSTAWGLKAATGLINQLGEISGETERLIVYAGPVLSLQLAGAILMGIGLFRASESLLSKEEKNSRH